MAGFDFNTPMMANFPGDSNPFNASLMAQLAANNPQLVAQAAAASGIPPPTGQMPVNGIDFNQSPLGAFLTPSASDPSSPAAVGGAAAPAGPPTAAAGANPWSMLQGFKGPQSTAPIMSGGVAGAQKAPEVGLAGASGGNAQLQQLVASIIAAHQQQSAQVKAPGSLGSYLGR